MCWVGWKPEKLSELALFTGQVLSGSPALHPEAMGTPHPLLPPAGLIYSVCFMARLIQGRVGLKVKTICLMPVFSGPLIHAEAKYMPNGTCGGVLEPKYMCFYQLDFVSLALVRMCHTDKWKPFLNPFLPFVK